MTTPYQHEGSWTNPFTGTPIPDRGVTEWFGNLIGAGQTGQQGSDIIPNTSASTLQGLSQTPSFKSGDPYAQTSTQTGNNNHAVLPWSNSNTNTNNNNNTNNTNTGTSQYPADRYIGWDPTAAQADWEAKQRAGGGGGGQSIEDMISEAYGPALQALGGIESSLLTGKEEALGNIGADYTGGQETIGREQTELESALKEQGRRLSESARGAYADAIRAYNNLVQQGLSRFGAGSSAGPAVQELVNQEFLRSRGKMGQQELAGQQQLAREETRLGNYIQQKRDDLDKWKRGAVTQINDNFRNAMAEINSRRADIEANKTRDKIAALQDAINQAQQVSTADKQFRMGLAQFAVEQMQNFAQRAFTPQEIASVVNDIMGQELGTFSERTSPAATQYRLPGYRSTTEEDEIKKLGQTT